ncbi:TPA: nucleoside hydrolase [Klebsiella pneumoniae]
MKPYNIILDTDPGIDDALAIGLAIFSPELNLNLLTTVHGNVSLEKTTRNAQLLMHFFGCNTPIASGVDKPLLKAQRGNLAHGESGLDGFYFDNPNKDIMNISAIEALRRFFSDNEGNITLVAIGPLTNVAIFFITYPELISRIDELVIMGGSLSQGNVTQFAEFNFWADPHAAKIVLESNVKKTIVGLDVTNNALVSSGDLVKAGNTSSTMFGSIFKCYIDGNLTDGVWMHDACTIALMCERDIFKFEEKYVDIIVDGPAEGAMFEKENGSLISYATEINLEKFKSWIVKTLTLMP